jgi:hypothetical protein
LALIYIKERRYDDATAVLNDLSNLGEDEFRAFALAGQAYILTAQGYYKESSKVIDELMLILNYLNNSQMHLYATDAIKLNRAKLGSAAIDIEEN